jgi:hypothetical protein
MFPYKCWEPTRSQLEVMPFRIDIGYYSFFAGHSVSDLDRITWQIYINQNDGLTLNELKYALQRSVQQDYMLQFFSIL